MVSAVCRLGKSRNICTPSSKAESFYALVPQNLEAQMYLCFQNADAGTIFVSSGLLKNAMIMVVSTFITSRRSRQNCSPCPSLFRNLCYEVVVRWASVGIVLKLREVFSAHSRRSTCDLEIDQDETFFLDMARLLGCDSAPFDYLTPCKSTLRTLRTFPDSLFVLTGLASLHFCSSTCDLVVARWCRSRGKWSIRSLSTLSKVVHTAGCG